jgi:hypothetical protein
VVEGKVFSGKGMVRHMTSRSKLVIATSTAVHCVDITCVAKESRKNKERIWKDLNKTQVTHKKKDRSTHHSWQMIIISQRLDELECDFIHLNVAVEDRANHGINRRARL